MSASKIALVVLILLVIFGGILFYQYTKTASYKDKVTVNNKTFMIQVVSKPADMEKGLSGRTSMNEDQGMLFAFGNKGDHPFWMKDMKFPLDIIFLDDTKIVTIVENNPIPTSPTASLPLIRSTQPANKVLEINSGIAKKYNLKVGQSVQYTIK